MKRKKIMLAALLLSMAAVTGCGKEAELEPVKAVSSVSEEETAASSIAEEEQEKIMVDSCVIKDFTGLSEEDKTAVQNDLQEQIDIFAGLFFDHTEDADFKEQMTSLSLTKERSSDGLYEIFDNVPSYFRKKAPDIAWQSSELKSIVLITHDTEQKTQAAVNVVMHVTVNNEKKAVIMTLYYLQDPDGWKLMSIVPHVWYAEDQDITCYFQSEDSTAMGWDIHLIETWNLKETLDDADPGEPDAVYEINEDGNLEEVETGSSEEGGLQ